MSITYNNKVIGYFPYNDYGVRYNYAGSDPTKELAKLASFLIIGDKADGASAGKNSPIFTNPWTDLSGEVGVNLESNTIGITPLVNPRTSYGSKIKIDPALPIYYTFDVPSLHRPAYNFYDANDNLITAPINGFIDSATTIFYYDASASVLGHITGVDISAKRMYTVNANQGIHYIKCGLWTPASVVTADLITNRFVSQKTKVYEPSSKSNILLQGFNATSSSGWKQETNGGKTFVGLQFDGVNDLGIGNNPRLDIVGTIDFGIGKVTKVPTLTTRYLLTKAEQSEATMQYGLKITNTGVLSIILNGTDIQLATGLLANTFYAIWVERISGVLKCFINGVEVFSVANNTSLVSRPNFVLGAMSTNVGGTAWTGFSNAFVGCAVITKTDIPKSRVNFNKMTKKIYNIG